MLRLSGSQIVGGLFGILLGWVCVAAPVAAQSRGQDQMIVTGERRSQQINDAGVSLSVVSADALAIVNADHISEALARAPGVNLHRGSGVEHLTSIRSPVLTAGAGAGSFLFLENGVPLRSPGFANINGLFDSHFEVADQIEILRGPSGALYGANAIHGLINVISPTPTDDRSIALEAFGDMEERFKAKASLSANGFLVGASIVSEAGFREDASLDQQKLTLRHHGEIGRVTIDTIASFNNLEQETAGFIFGRDALFDRDARRENQFPQAFRDSKTARLQSTFSVDVGEGEEIRVTPYFRWTDMDFLQHFLPSNALEETSHWSVGFQSGWYRDVGRWNLIAGIDGEYTEGELIEFQSMPTIFSFTQGLHYDYEIQAVNASGFAQGRYAFSPATSLTLAVRIDGTIYDYTNRTDSGIVGRFLRLPDQTDRFVTASPKATLRHDFDERTSLFVSFARGARAPQTTDLYRLQINQTGDAARPEIIDSGEIGLRGEFGARVNYALTGFFSEKRNFFFRDADGFNVSNGITRHTGVEADIQIVLHKTLNLSSALSWARHTYRFDRLTGNAFESIQFGDDVDTAPRVLANTRLGWQPSDRVFLEAEWRHVSSYFLDAANSRSYEGYDVINLKAEWRLRENFAIFGSVRNVADTLYAERADFAFGSERFFPAEERTFGLGFRFQ